ncbi:Leo1-like protein-domain-containing protein [Kockovaella imperatae]|uniref:Leo1-like protein-domain-containing protein n=1 Tax=Kockovaella imperatae TaxID=4999 RepID=A0A1Y1UCV2_9TREE|nr:Leo1-like protein-domain-containing protein [Kockovaella imperatae]ORX35354.1 Leo1-like protein-domain-containing protein [Kockovaella imperatae]
MSEGELAEDLFPASGSGSPAKSIGEDAPVASGSRSQSPAQPTLENPVEEPVDDDDDGDLFGDDDEEDAKKSASPRSRAASSSATPKTPPTSASEDGGEGSAHGSPNPLEYAEEEVGVEQDVIWANIALPKMPRLKATDGKIWQLRLPAYVNIEPKPYDAHYYQETLNESEIDGSKDPMGAKSRMLGVKNTIRWRWVMGPEGKPVRKSNARMLRWSDGSMSLQLGSNLFDVAASHGATLQRDEDIKDVKPSTTSQPEASTSQTNATFLCVAVGSERVLMTEGPIAGQLSLVPTSMTSATHLELAKHVGQQHVKHSRMKILEDEVKPETLANLQREAAGKSVVTKLRVKRPTGSRGESSRRNQRGRRARSESSGSERGFRREKDYEEDDGFVVADDDDEEEAEETEDEDDAAWGSKKSKSKSSKRAKRRKGSESLDELEEADRRLEERERERKRAKKAKAKSRDYVDSDEDDEDEVDDADEMEGGDDDADMAMDVESEDD